MGVGVPAWWGRFDVGAGTIRPGVPIPPSHQTVLGGVRVPALFPTSRRPGPIEVAHPVEVPLKSGTPLGVGIPARRSGGPCPRGRWIRLPAEVTASGRRGGAGHRLVVGSGRVVGHGDLLGSTGRVHQRVTHGLSLARSCQTVLRSATAATSLAAPSPILSRRMARPPTTSPPSSATSASILDNVRPGATA